MNVDILQILSPVTMTFPAVDFRFYPLCTRYSCVIPIYYQASLECGATNARLCVNPSLIGNVAKWIGEKCPHNLMDTYDFRTSNCTNTTGIQPGHQIPYDQWQSSFSSVMPNRILLGYPNDILSDMYPECYESILST